MKSPILCSGSFVSSRCRIGLLAAAWLLTLGQPLFGQTLATAQPGNPAPEISRPVANSTPGKCSLSAEQVHEFHGLQLGMTEPQVRQLFRTASRYQQAGVFDGAEQHLHLCVRGCKSAAERERRAAHKSRFKGIASIHFTFAQGLLTQFTVYFQERTKPADAQLLSQNLATELGVSGQWQGNPFLATLDCAGFRLRVEGQSESKLALIVTH